jgi:hypothetical protein
MLTISKRDVHVWVLSLPNSQRRSVMSERLGKHNVPFQFMDGVLVDMEDLEAEMQRHSELLRVPLPSTSKLPKGDLGCLLAYLHMCRRIVDEALPWVLILEDDVFFNPKFADHIATMNLADYICSDWTFVHPNYGYSTLGQVVTYVGAKKVLKRAGDILRVGLAIDLALFSDLLSELHYAVCYGTDNWLVDQDTPYNEKEFSERMQLNES